MLKLYSYWRSSASYRVRIALALKGLEYEYAPVNIFGPAEQHQPEYRALNPQSRVPLLVDGKTRVAQSLAILDYLEGLYPRPSLVPGKLAERARMQMFCQTIAADIQPLQNTGPLLYLRDQFKTSDEQRNAWIRHWIERGLSVLEEDYGKGIAEFTLGDEPTWADCLLIPQVFNAERFECDHSRFPRLYAAAKRIRELAPFRKAHPHLQPDATP